MKWGIANIKGGSGGASNTILTTTTDATENSGTYTLALSNLSETPKVNDYVVYVDNGNLTTLYQVSAIGSTDATLEKIGDIGGGGGKQLYQHNIELKIETSSSVYAEIVLQIINDSNVAFTKDSLATYATYSADRPINNIIANGFWFDKTNNKQYRVNKLYNYSSLQWSCTDCNVASVAGSSIAPIYANFTYTISDSIIPL